MNTDTPLTDAVRGETGRPNRAAAYRNLSRRLERDRAALIAALEPIDRWFREGNAPLYPGALIGDDDRDIAETISATLARVRS